jgi:hypothetical protein
MVAVSGDDVAPPPLRLQIMLSHKATQLFAVDHHALLTQRRTDTTISVALELIADRPDPDDEVMRVHRDGRRIIEGRA